MTATATAVESPPSSSPAPATTAVQTARSSAGDQRVGRRRGQQAVDVVEVVAQDRDGDRGGEADVGQREADEHEVGATEQEVARPARAAGWPAPAARPAPASAAAPAAPRRPCGTAPPPTNPSRRAAQQRREQGEGEPRSSAGTASGGQVPSACGAALVGRRERRRVPGDQQLNTTATAGSPATTHRQRGRATGRPGRTARAARRARTTTSTRPARARRAPSSRAGRASRGRRRVRLAPEDQARHRADRAEQRTDTVVRTAPDDQQAEHGRRQPETAARRARPRRRQPARAPARPRRPAARLTAASAPTAAPTTARPAAALPREPCEQRKTRAQPRIRVDPRPGPRCRRRCAGGPASRPWGLTRERTSHGLHDHAPDAHAARRPGASDAARARLHGTGARPASARPAHSSEPLRPTGRSPAYDAPAHATGHPVPIDPVAARRAPRDLRRACGGGVLAVLLPLGPLSVAGRVRAAPLHAAPRSPR